MFRFENKLPKYMVNESRDFQLMNRLNDSLYMGQRADIQTIINLNSSDKCKNSILDLLAKKVGFFTTKYIDDNVLRYIIGAFQTAVKNKGTKLGIIQAVTAILKAENSIDEPHVEIYKDDVVNPDDAYQIKIFTPIVIVNKIALEEFLKYIIPAGWTYSIQAYQKSNDPYTTIMQVDDEVKLLKTSTVLTSTVRASDGEYKKDGSMSVLDTSIQFADGILGAIDLGVIPNEEDYENYVNDVNESKQTYVTESTYTGNLEEKQLDE